VFDSVCIVRVSRPSLAPNLKSLLSYVRLSAENNRSRNGEIGNVKKTTDSEKFVRLRNASRRYDRAPLPKVAYIGRTVNFNETIHWPSKRTKIERE